MSRYLLIALLLLLIDTGYAQFSQDTVKSHYSLWHPCPKDKMRGFETDRPDATESPYTLDAGHFQYETDLFKTERTKVNGIKTVVNSFNEFNIKAGLTNSTDIEFVAETFVNTKIKDGISPNMKSSFNTITIRVKQNLWGNDKGKTALGILPFINIPTTSDETVTGGFVIPFALSLPYNWSFGSQIGMDFAKNQTGNNYHVNNLISATVSHQVIRDLDFFVEGLVSRENELKQNVFFVNSGLVYELNENLKLDTGIYYGIKNTSSQVYFIGLSFRY